MFSSPFSPFIGMCLFNFFFFLIQSVFCFPLRQLTVKSGDHAHLLSWWKDRQQRRCEACVCVRGQMWIPGLHFTQRARLVISWAPAHTQTHKDMLMLSVLSVSCPAEDDCLLRLNTAQHDCPHRQRQRETKAGSVRPQLTFMHELRQCVCILNSLNKITISKTVVSQILWSTLPCTIAALLLSTSTF